MVMGNEFKAELSSHAVRKFPVRTMIKSFLLNTLYRSGGTILFHSIDKTPFRGSSPSPCDVVKAKRRGVNEAYRVVIMTPGRPLTTLRRHCRVDKEAFPQFRFIRQYIANTKATSVQK